MKINSDEWLEVMQVAHELGLKSSATMMFGHVETIEDRVEHLQRIRDQQDRSGGFTAFICWTFQPQHTVLKVKQPTGVSEYLRMQALARIFLDNIDNIQSSWVTQGPDIGQIALKIRRERFRLGDDGRKCRQQRRDNVSAGCRANRIAHPRRRLRTAPAKIGTTVELKGRNCSRVSVRRVRPSPHYASHSEAATDRRSFESSTHPSGIRVI